MKPQRGPEIIGSSCFSGMMLVSIPLEPPLCELCAVSCSAGVGQLIAGGKGKVVLTSCFFSVEL